jgi:hypothetical protein
MVYVKSYCVRVEQNERAVDVLPIHNDRARYRNRYDVLVYDLLNETCRRDLDRFLSASIALTRRP